MSLISTIKSILGLGDGDRAEEGTTVTVEREPDLSGETDVGDSDGSTESTPPVEEPDEPEPDVDPETTVDDDGTDAEAAAPEAGDDGEPVESIDGIGPAYAARLGDAGVASVEDLAAADASELADATDIAETRIQGWIDQASSS